MFNLDLPLPVVFFSHTKSISATSLHPANSTFFTTNQHQLSTTASRTERLAGVVNVREQYGVGRYSLDLKL